MILTVQREPTTRDAVTFGALYLDGAWCAWTLEDEIRERAGVPVPQWKVPGSTAIPSGRYRLVLSLSQRFHLVLPEVLHVPGFTGVRIHAGNVISETEGCLLVGGGRTVSTVTGSRVALEKLLAAIPPTGEHWLDVRLPHAAA